MRLGGFVFVCRAAYLHFRWQIQYQLSLTHIVSLTLSKPICQTLKSYGANAVSSGISNHRTPLFYACSCVCLSRLPWQTNSTFIISYFPLFLFPFQLNQSLWRFVTSISIYSFFLNKRINDFCQKLTSTFIICNSLKLPYWFRSFFFQHCNYSFGI